MGKKYKHKIILCNYDKLTVSIWSKQKYNKFIGINLGESCMSSHNNSRSIKTASQQQVRKKIYKDSSKEWFKFEPFIGNIFSSIVK